MVTDIKHPQKPPTDDKSAPWGTDGKVGERIKLLRIAWGLGGERQKKPFADGAGANPSELNQAENGTRGLSLANAYKLCARYGATLDYLYRGHHWTLSLDLADAVRRRTPMKRPSE
jgi:hypothetical protein